MITARIWGGLGNQLFQYAYAYTVAQRAGACLQLDMSFYENQTVRKPVLLDFSLDNSEVCTLKDLPDRVRELQGKWKNRALWISKNSQTIMPNGQLYIKESRLHYMEHLAKLNCDDIYLDGYWQCPLYFEQARKHLIRQYKLKNSDYLRLNSRLVDAIKDTDSVAIHIRRGDYLNKWNQIVYGLRPLPDSYYLDTINQARRKFDDPLFVFFTNDPDYVKDKFGSLPNVLLVPDMIQATDAEEMMIMSLCKNHIIANSTFSWWAAWLSENPDQSVWAPKTGWGNRDILPDRWKGIEIKWNQ